MVIKKKIIITEAQRGLLFKDLQFVKVLPPGVADAVRLAGGAGRYADFLFAGKGAASPPAA